MLSPNLNNSDKTIQDLLFKREYTRAEVLIQERLTKNPQSADGYYWQAVLQYYQGKIGASVDNLKRVLEIDPKHTDAAICLSVLYNDVGKYPEAKGVFEQANQSVKTNVSSTQTEIDRKFAVKHLELADLYFRYRRYDEAIEEYSKAIGLDHTMLDVKIRRAKVYAKKGFVTRAIQELQQMKHENQRFIPARVQLGLLQYSQGNVLDAELEWETILEIEPNNREALAYLEMAKRERVT
jgi:tetratricopeptide (TPR) repeat protein